MPGIISHSNPLDNQHCARKESLLFFHLFNQVGGRPGTVVGDLDVSEASVSDQLHSRCAQSLGQGDEGLQLGQYLCWYHGSIHCCCCQLTLQQQCNKLVSDEDKPKVCD